MGAVSMTPDFAVVEELVCDDETIAYGMGEEALLNSLDLGGVARVLIKMSDCIRLLKGFVYKN